MVRQAAGRADEGTSHRCAGQGSTLRAPGEEWLLLQNNTQMFLNFSHDVWKVYFRLL